MEPEASAQRRAAPRAERGGRPRVVRRALHGVLLLDKPHGLSSNDALQIARRLYRAEKAGHTGTLDPLATGLLPLCFGAATKFSHASLDADKAYRATLRLGQTTTTGDLEGEVVDERPVEIDRAAIDAVLARYTGAIEQIPPMHSAIKKHGKALYEYARAGVDVEREARRVMIHSLAVSAWDRDTLVLDVVCSKGTYVRTLATDIGSALGCGAHLAGLRRTGCGTLTLEGAVSLAELDAMTEAERDARLLPVDATLSGWPAVVLGADDAARFLSGMRRRVAQADCGKVRVYGPPQAPGCGPALLGSAHIACGELIADRLLSPPEVQAIARPQRHDRDGVPDPVGAAAA